MLVVVVSATLLKLTKLVMIQFFENEQTEYILIFLLLWVGFFLAEVVAVVDDLNHSLGGLTLRENSWVRKNKLRHFWGFVHP